MDDLSKDWDIEDMPKLKFFIDPGRIYGEPYALSLNKEIIDKIQDPNFKDRIKLSMFPRLFKDWLISIGLFKEKVTLAGKNIQAFDLKFLERIEGWNSSLFHRRVLDPAALWMEPQVDKELPNLDTCLKRAGYEKSVTHDALDDAIDVVRVVRAWYKPRDI